MGAPCYSARFVQPFAELLSRYENFRPESLSRLRAIDPATRIPINAAHELVLDQIQQTGDAALGVKAARIAGLGRGGALDYAINSAATVRKAIETGARHTRLFSDSLRMDLVVDGRRATVRLLSSIPAPSAIPDFAVAFWYSNHTRTPLGDSPKLECWFEHPAPRQTDEYDRTFAGATLHFDAPFYGVSFDSDYLDAPLPSSDPGLHVLLCEHVALLESKLASRVTFSHRVREITMNELLDRAPTLESAARQLHMSQRTLSNRLKREGTSFSALLDHVRRELALGYVEHHELSHTEMAFRLGFSHVEAFYRAFKRWTGQTPLTYRRTRASSAPAPRGSVFPGAPMGK